MVSRSTPQPSAILSRRVIGRTLQPTSIPVPLTLCSRKGVSTPGSLNYRENFNLYFPGKGKMFQNILFLTAQKVTMPTHAPQKHILEVSGCVQVSATWTWRNSLYGVKMDTFTSLPLPTHTHTRNFHRRPNSPLSINLMVSGKGTHHN